MSNPEIRPCPYCGNYPRITVLEDSSAYVCCVCLGRIGIFSSEAEAIESWNNPIDMEEGDGYA